MTPAGSEPLVDVGIPAYERPRYIVETIESVLAQTMPRWRLTISDDGPGGGAVQEAIAPYLSDRRIRYSATGNRVGQMANWNRLVMLATAPYVAILHDDDRWQPRCLERHVTFLEANPACGFVFSGTNRIDHEGGLLAQCVPPLVEGVHWSDDFIRRLLFANLVGSTPSVLVRRSAYDTVGLFDEALPHSDYEMWVRLALRFPVGYLGSVDADYRVHTQSTTHAERPDGRRVLRLADRFVELADKERPGLLTRRDRRRVAAGVLLGEISFDALGDGHRRHASWLLMRAVAAYPPVLVDGRVLNWVRIAVGPRLRRSAAQVRRAWAGAWRRLSSQESPRGEGGLQP